MNFSILDHLAVLTKSDRSESKYICPICSGSNLDIKKDGKYSCFSGECSPKAIASAVLTLAGSPPQNPNKKSAATKTEYFYTAREGKPLAKTVRTDDLDRDGNSTKKFSQAIYSGGEWCWKPSTLPELKKRIPIYRYTEVQEAIDQGQRIFIVEGEKAADALWLIGIPATTTIGGSSAYKSNGDYSQDLKGAQLILCPDRDQPGLKYIGLFATDFNSQVDGYYLAGEMEGWTNPSDGRDLADDISDRGFNKAKILASIITVEKFNSIALSGEPELDADKPDTKAAVDAKLITIASDYPIHKLFPKSIADPVAEYCKRTAVPHGLIAMAVITCLATLLHPESQLACFGGTNRIVKAIFWFGVYGQSGNGKSHSYAPTLDILRRFGRDANDVYQAEVKDWEALQKRVKRSKPEDLDSETLDKADEPKPDRKRYVVDSTTIEALLTRAAKQPDRGLLMYADELIGWCHRMDPTKGEVELWLSLKSGKPVDGERQTREFAYVPSPSISVMGGIQPDVMAKLVEKQEEIQNGFLPRLTLVRFEETPTPPLSDLEPPDFSPLEKLFIAVKENNAPIELKLDNSCFSSADEWGRETSDSRINDSRKSFKVLYPKFNELGYQVAMMLHVINRTLDSSQPEKIPLATFQTALDFTRWLLGQSVSIYEELIEVDQPESLITKFVGDCQYKGWMKTRDVMRMYGGAKFRTAESAKEFMSTLVSFGYAEANESESTSRKYQIRVCPSKRQVFYDKPQGGDCPDKEQVFYDNMTKDTESQASKGFRSSFRLYDTYDRKSCGDELSTVSASSEKYDKTIQTEDYLPLKEQSDKSLSYCHSLSYGQNDSQNPDTARDVDNFVLLSYERGKVNGQVETENPIPEATDEEFS
jgi:Protein of unknown function (DUF3987)